jgi:hypothetical protein
VDRTRLDLPDLTTYRLHRRVDQAHLDSAAVPGLQAEYFHHDRGDRTASAGRYRYAGRDILLAWGFTDEQNCRFSAVRDPDGRWHPATDGCPTVEILHDGDAVAGIRIRTGTGGWLVCRGGEITSAN